MKRAAAITIFFAGILALPGGTVRTLAGKSYSGYVRFIDEATLGIGPAKGEVVKVPLAKVAYASFEPPDDLSQLETGVPLAGKGTGLLGAYYSRPGQKGRVVYRIDETVDFAWGMDKPIPDANHDYFSIRWTGDLEAPATGVYTFYIDANDGATLNIGDQLKLGQMDPETGFVTKGKLKLVAGKRYPLLLDFSNDYGRARMRLQWSGPGIPRSPIPRQQLYPRPGLLNSGEPVAGVHGLLGAYFPNRGFSGLVFMRVDPRVDFKWEKGPGKKIPPDNYSVCWMGQLESGGEGEHLFHLTVDEGVTLWMDGKRVLSDPYNNAHKEISVRITLKQKKRYDFRLDLVNRRGGTKLRMEWTPPNGKRTLLPMKNLYASFAPVPPDEADVGKVDLTSTLGVFTWGGSRIAQAVSAADATSVRFANGHSPARISTVNVARIVFQPIPERFTDTLPKETRGVLLKTGDFIEGKFHSFAEGSVSIESALFGRRKYGILDVLALQLEKIKGPPAAANFTADLEDGSRFHLRTCRLQKDRLELDDPTVGRFEIGTQELIELKRISAKE